MMKYITKGYCIILPILLIVFFAACNNTTNVHNKQGIPENSKTVQVHLVDSLGMIGLSVPISYDTSFSWIHYSDCGKPCDEQKYRFQPKTLSIVKETGWYSKESLTDPINRLTISHSSFIRLQGGTMRTDSIRHKHLMEQLTSDPVNPPIIFDTMQEINDRYYSIIVMEKSDTLFSKKILASTTIKNNVVKFQYELLTKKNDSITDSFIKNSIKLIKTIRISKGI
ncbi:MAG: hypothetical protein QM687_17225 [Ferruginibacter sp.]